jgi:hypothetical protein
MVNSNFSRGMQKMRSQPRPKDRAIDSTSFAILIIGIVVIGIILMLIIRIQRGLLGVILAGVATFLLVYWLREIRRTMRDEWIPLYKPKPSAWTYDLLKRGSEVTFVAEVPGPESEVRTRLTGNILEVMGGQNFYKQIRLPSEAEETKATYHNGVIEVRMKSKQSSEKN